MATSTHASISADTHSTIAGGGWSTKRIATTALFCALAFVLTFVEIPIFPPAPWLAYDPSGIVAFVAALVFGPVTGAIVVVLPWVVKTLFTFNVWGHLMAIIANLALIVPAALIERRMEGKKGMVAGMVAGSIIALVACIICNLIVTPLYTAVSVADVVAMIVPILIPFNVLKLIINCVGTALVYPPASKALSA